MSKSSLMGDVASEEGCLAGGGCLQWQACRNIPDVPFQRETQVIPEIQSLSGRSFSFIVIKWFYLKEQRQGCLKTFNFHLALMNQWDMVMI